MYMYIHNSPSMMSLVFTFHLRWWKRDKKHISWFIGSRNIIAGVLSQPNCSQRTAVVHFNFRAVSTSCLVPVCSVPSSMGRASRCNKVDPVRLYASNWLNLLLLKGQRCVSRTCAKMYLDFPMELSLHHELWFFNLYFCNPLAIGVVNLDSNC